MLPRWSSVGSDLGEYVPMTRDGKASPVSSPVRTLVLRLIPPAFLICLGMWIGMHYPSFLSVYTRRPPELPSYLPIALPPPPTTSPPSIMNLPPPREPIPNIVHYVYGLDTAPQPDFPYFAYLAMRSAMLTLRPDRVLFHCIREPKGYWWDRVKGWEGWTDEFGVNRGGVEIVRARNVQHVGKDRRPVRHYAHKADIIRLEVLQAYGGVYLDIDTFVLRPFAPLSLYSYDTVLGMEARILDFLRGPRSDHEMDPKGLCNAVIISRADSVFIQRWLDSYDGFDETKWTEHSVEMPWTVAKLYPTTVTVLSERAFFWPLWSDDHIHAVYGSTEYDFEASGQLAYHAWESVARKYLDALDPVTIQTTDTSFTRMARRFREPGEERRWKAASKLDGAGSDGGGGEMTQQGGEGTGLHDRPDVRKVTIGRDRIR